MTGQGNVDVLRDRQIERKTSMVELLVQLQIENEYLWRCEPFP